MASTVYRLVHRHRIGRLWRDDYVLFCALVLDFAHWPIYWARAPSMGTWAVASTTNILHTNSIRRESIKIVCEKATNIEFLLAYHCPMVSYPLVCLLTGRRVCPDDLLTQSHEGAREFLWPYRSQEYFLQGIQHDGGHLHSSAFLL